MERRATLMTILLVVAVCLCRAVSGQDETDTSSTNRTECACVNGVCSRSRESPVSCVCDRHWEGDLCDQVQDQCAGDPCSDTNANCEISEQGFQCSCKPGYVTGSNGKCEASLLWQDYWADGIFHRLDVTSQPTSLSHVTLQWEFPMPFFSLSSLYMRITNQGYVQFGPSPNETRDLSINPFVKSSWSAWPFYLAPYWTNFVFDQSSNTSDVFYTQESRYDEPTKNSSLLDYAKSVIQSGQFEPLQAVSVTWSNALPHTCHSCDERATVQLVVATDFRFTYAIITWHDLFSGTDLFGGPQVVSGHSGAEGTFIALDAKPRTRFVVPLFSAGNPTSVPIDCIRAKGEAGAGKNWSALIPCPCQEKDVILDFRFIPDAGANMPDRQCYEARYFSGGLKQACCYDHTNLHISPPMEAALPVEEPPISEPSLQTAKELCCSINPAFCTWFYRDFPACQAGPVIKFAAGAGYGSLHMSTFDRRSLTLNGWGEYILLQSGDMEIQARTDRRGDGNTTYFTAYAFKPFADAGNYQVYITADGTLEHGPSTTPHPDPSVFTSHETPGEDSVTLTTPGLSLRVEKQSGNSLAHTITLPATSTTRGLSGSSENPTAGDLDNPEQWRVHWKNMSLFDYLQPSPTTFEAVNSHEGFEPQVLPMDASQILALFDDETLRNQSEVLCGQAVFCLQEFYLFGDADQAASDALAWSMRLAETARTIDMMPPEFEQVQKTMFTPENILNNSSLELRVASATSEHLRFSLEGSFAALEGVSIDGNAVKFTNLNLTDLRALAYPQSLGFVATDSRTNLSATHWPLLYFCLCEENAQCLHYGLDYVDKSGQLSTPGNLIQVGCQCTQPNSPWSQVHGRFCEKQVEDVCTNCYNQTACDSSQAMDACQPCPQHMGGDGILCRDIDECKTNNGGCQQTCTNTHTGASCSCLPGYATNGSRCLDNNECIGTPNICNSSNQYCFNTQGSHTCRCYGNRLGDDCVFAPFTYSGTVELAPVSGQRGRDVSESTNTELRAAIAQSLMAKLTTGPDRVGTEQTLFVEVPGFIFHVLQRSRRAVDRVPEVEAIFVIRSTTQLEENQVSAALNLTDCVANCDLAGTLVYSVPSVQTGNLCEIPSINRCDGHTTECMETENNLVVCSCLSGFKQSADPLVCTDVNECLISSDNKCSHARNCSNTIGSYTCRCDSGFYWDRTSETCRADACQPGPCRDDWQCHITDAGPGYVCSPKDGDLGDDDADDWKLALIIVSVVLGVLCLCLLIAVIILALRRRKTLEMDAYSNSRYSDVAGHPTQQGFSKRGSNTEMTEQLRNRNVYQNAPGHNGNYTQAYANSAYSSDRL